jgi:low temperature requirement protein LtrA
MFADMLKVVAPLRVCSNRDTARKVTWLELFFDLIFVAAVAQVAGPLRHEYSFDGLVRFTPLFILIWWAWTGQTVFSTRFQGDDLIQRGLTLVQIFVVAVMAANARDALDSRSSAGFAAAYAAMRLLLVAQYLRARSLPEARPLATHHLLGHGSAALLWLGSALMPAPARFWVWGVALVLDLGTPWLGVAHSVKVPPDAAHLPERFGLFTLILLGESVVAVMQGMESQDDWSPAAATSAFAGMATLFVIWWWYFDGATGASKQPVRTRREALRFHVWSYAHFPLYLGIIVLGVGIQRIVTAAARAALTAADGTILAAAATLLMVAMTAIAATSATRRRNRPGLLVHLMLATTMLVLGTGVRNSGSPVLIIGLIASVSVAQLSLAIFRLKAATSCNDLLNRAGKHTGLSERNIVRDQVPTARPANR